MGVFSFKRRRKRPGKVKPTPDPRLRFRGVEIRFAKDACAAVEALAGRRYLSAEAPLLPLSDCDRRAHCDCRYVKFADRRRGPRRKSEGALPTGQEAAGADEQRRDQGRRAEERESGGRPLPWFKDIPR